MNTPPPDDPTGTEPESRQSKKIRTRDEEAPPLSNNAWATGGISFRDKVLQGAGDLHDPFFVGDVPLEDEDVAISQTTHSFQVSLSEAFLDRITQPWKKALVVKLLGKTLSYKTMSSRLETLWKPMGRLTVIDLENEFFLVRFQKEEDYQRALCEGPWVILGAYLTVQCWSPDFVPSQAKPSHVVAWIRFPAMPIQYYHAALLEIIAGNIGRVIRVDYNTVSASRGRFARVAVELDLSKPLISSFEIEGLTQLVEYENLPTICFSCGVIGHLKEQCSKQRTSGEPEGIVSEGSAAERAEKSEHIAHSTVPSELGPWMHAKKPIRRTRKEITLQKPMEKTKVQPSKADSYKSHGKGFQILATLEEGGSSNAASNEISQPTGQKELSLPKRQILTTHRFGATQNERPSPSIQLAKDISPNISPPKQANASSLLPGIPTLPTNPTSPHPPQPLALPSACSISVKHPNPEPITRITPPPDITSHTAITLSKNDPPLGLDDDDPPIIHDCSNPGRGQEPMEEDSREEIEGSDNSMYMLVPDQENEKTYGKGYTD
ncbi:PREDICTED: uncharacterized protein LOC104799464 [Tarenaya hassleriana]|uniref:uncharacterized protein LOC104799464 n=1 Tax=Tarenaya hassleriana TaxID=28532 RepID=UPI00053C16AE|nr:PREDICTED: uncharacterized protein LOC104799464 [Tarenaya hassleriana]